MPYCNDCKKYKKGKHEIGSGTFPASCLRYGIGVNPDWDSCPQIDPLDLSLSDRGKMPDKKHNGGTKESEFFE
jgi:hypothetical protein